MRCERIYSVVHGEATVDGTGVMVDRLWPRGVSKAETSEFLWLKNVAPSPELRKWFDHDPKKFEEFSKRYREELNANESEDLERLLSLDEATLLYAAKDAEHNHALVLAQWCAEAQSQKT
ncbi:DUF488 domain-containing protein [Corynebacterium gerontici]|uniref:Uncharacterized protein n=1 Tax=Corynebacterium gerontici TaxID=2079234 RepID=A0A3G6J1S3_9CORY|nr:DUF488 family protein [Corynebacterium gerontici]AZA10928.1 hypothetical protein CGERO_03025 [Corynebacterium gerontici]